MPRSSPLTRIARAVLIALGLVMLPCAGWVFRIQADAAVTVTPPEVKALVEDLQKHYQDTQSFSAKFTETITRVGGPPEERQGTVYYSKPGRVRFDFTSPQPETLVSDGTTFYDYDPGLNQVMETPLKNVLKTPTAAAFLMGAGNIEREFDASPGPEDKAGQQSLWLTPKGGGDRIGLGIDPANFNIVTLQLGDALGNVTVFHFDDIRVNVPLEAILFAFKVPAGADIVGPAGVQ